MSIQLSHTQRAILSAAAQRDDRCLMLAQTLRGGAAQKVAAKLIAAGLAKEIKAKAGTPVWRRDKQAEQSYALKLTAAGAKAIATGGSPRSGEVTRDDRSRDKVVAIQPPTEQRPIPNRSSIEIAKSAAANPTAPRSGGKLAHVVELLQRDRGATLDELVTATGWLAHTTRAALSGLRKRGYCVAIDRSDKDRGSTYRIESNRSVAVGTDAALKEAPRVEEPPAVPAGRSKKRERHAESRARQAA